MTASRRSLLALVASTAAAGWPGAVWGQQERVRRIGFLRAAPPPEHELDAFLRALAALGYAQGHNFVLVPQWGDGSLARLSELAVTLINQNVDVIVTEGTLMVRAAAAVTTSIPIVTASAADPFVGGLIKNLSRPGGNVTGFVSMERDISGKVFQILKEMLPGLDTIAVLAGRSIWPVFAQGQDAAAEALGIKYAYIEMPKADAADAAMGEAAAAGAQGVVLRGSPFFSSVQKSMIVDSAAKHRLPTIYERRDDVERGGLVSYAPDVQDQYRATAAYVARVLAGENPGDLPIQQPTKFALVINLKTARALGLTIPATLLARADEVIE